jgi:Tfp pilus assembly protein PilO
MKHRLLALALAGLVLNLAFFFVAVLPTRRTARAHASTVQELQARLRSLRHEEQQQEILESLVKRMDQFRSEIPPHGAIIQMVRRITDEARKLRLSVPSVKYQPMEMTEEPLVKLSVQMEVGGSYAATRRFLYEVEGLQDPLVIEKLVLTSRQQKDRLTLRLEMAAYFLDETASGVAREAQGGRL